MNGRDCIPALKALGNESRLRILRLLMADSVSVTDIALRLGLSQYNVSKHLRIMREAGLLESQQHGKQRLYSVTKGLRKEIDADHQVLDLGCCTFKGEQL